MQDDTSDEFYKSQKLIEQDAIRKAFEILGEHFDTVQLFLTRHEPVIESGTLEYTQGIGNYYARFGQVQMWIEKQKAESTSESFNNFLDNLPILEEIDEDLDEDDEEDDENE